MEKINNYDVYTLGMKKSIRDKLFWEGLIDNNVNGVCDFGCADAQLLKIVKDDFPGWYLYGIDNDPYMIHLANDALPSAVYYNDLSEMKDERNCLQFILNVSSVIHEVYSYCSDEQIDKFWENLFGLGFRYIAIRDFMPSKNINGISDINDYQKILRRGDRRRISEFEDVWGSIRDRKNMVHYLMKYRYLENWGREVRENYFPITVEDFLTKVPAHYEIVYFNHYILPFNKERIREDFEINLKDNTHVKVLLKIRSDNENLCY